MTFFSYFIIYSFLYSLIIKLYKSNVQIDYKNATTCDTPLLWISAIKTCALSRPFYILEYTYLAFLPHHILIAAFSREKVYPGNNTNVYRKFPRAKTQRVHYRTLLYSSCLSALSPGSLHNVNFEKLAFSESHSFAYGRESFNFKLPF